MNDPVILRLDRVMPDQVEALAALLVDAVEGGAEAGFPEPFDLDDARQVWVLLAAEVEAGLKLLLVARDAHGVAGTVLLGLATPPYQTHRADVSMLLVHRRARRRGIARHLLARLEDEARDIDRKLLTLDTRPGDPAEALYGSAGWTLCGIIPGFTRTRDGSFDPTAIYWKAL